MYTKAQKEANRRYYAKNKEARSAANRAWRLAHKKERAAYKRLWNEAHRIQQNTLNRNRKRRIRSAVFAHDGGR
jgi:hypothetical protein